MGPGRLGLELHEEPRAAPQVHDTEASAVSSFLKNMLGIKQPKFAENEVVIAWQSFATDGVHEVIQKGVRLRGNHLAVRKCPGNFVRDGVPESEWPSQFEASDGPIAAMEAEAAAERARQAGPVIPFEHRLEVVTGFRTEDGFTFGEGEVVDERDKRLKKTIAEHPGAFAIPRRPLS